MPQAVPAIIVAAGQAIAGVAVAKIITAFVINVGLALLSEALSKKPRDPGVPPVNVTINDTVEFRHIVLGTRRVGGSFVDIRTSGPNNSHQFLWYVIAYADHQCNDLKDAWLDEFLVPDADINPTTGEVSTTWANGKLWIWSHVGTQAQSADAQLTATFGSGGGGGLGNWSSTDRLRGVAYRVIKMERDATAFPTGAPDHASALVEGALTYDWRLDSTNGGSGSHRMDNPSTWSFSDSWARNMLWLLTGGSVVNDQATRLVKYGIQEEYARIDWPFWTAAANISDDTLTGANATPDGDEVRYRLNAEFTCGQTRDEILSLAKAAGAGELVYVHGKWRLYAGAYDAPAHTFDQDDLHGDMDVEDTTDEEERVNRVSAIYVDPDQQWKEQTTLHRFNAAYDTQDKGREFPKEIDLRSVTSLYQADRISEIELRKARQMRRVVFRFRRRGMKIAPHETFSFSHARLGWVDREFRCLSRKRERTQDGGIIVVVTARAEAASIYTDLLTAEYSSGTSVTNSIQHEAPEAPTSLTAIPRPFAIEFTWQLGAFWTLHGITELWESATDSFGSATKVWEGRGTRYILPKYDTALGYYWVRMRTIAGQVSATNPTTNGVQASAFINSAQRICVDAEVQTPNPSLYWNAENAKATIVATGGVVGGLLRLAANGSAPNPGVRPIRPGGLLQASLGMQVKVRLRYRRTTALSTTDASDPTLSILLYSYQTVSGGANNEQDFQQINLAGLTLNQWYESSVTLEVTLNTMTSFASERPFVNLLCFLDTVAQTGSADGTVEIDLFDAVIVS